MLFWTGLTNLWLIVRREIDGRHQAFFFPLVGALRGSPSTTPRPHAARRTLALAPLGCRRRPGGGSAAVAACIPCSRRTQRAAIEQCADEGLVASCGE